MAPATDMDGLRAAWRALFGSEGGEGWKTIPIAGGPHWTLLAGRHLPGDEEALLVGFRNGRVATTAHLPQAHGFEVSLFSSIPSLGDGVWIVVARRSGGRPELFAAMASDLVRLLEATGAHDEDALPGRLIARIRAWQEFMDRRPPDVLSPESEVGLLGELVVLGRMVTAGMPGRNALAAWHGPLDGLQDFIIDDGAIEVKTTIAMGGFLAMVNCLEQLDDRFRRPLFLAAVRLSLDPSGVSLPEMADEIRKILCASFSSLDVFEQLLLQAGLLQMSTEHYTRRFNVRSVSVFEVLDNFPRLTREGLHPAIRKARYEVDLDLAGALDIGLVGALKQLGAI